jgi:hypothetical protein
MDSKANTKVEVLAEAIENIAIAIAADALQKVGGKDLKAIRDRLDAERKSVREALREFLRPALRVVEPQRYEADFPSKDKVICEFCKKDHPCRIQNCHHWHASVRERLNEVRGSDGGEAA